MRPHRHRLITTCPDTGQMVPTNLVGRERLLRRYDGRVIFWCRACRGVHGLELRDGRLAREEPVFGNDAPPLMYACA